MFHVDQSLRYVGTYRCGNVDLSSLFCQTLFYETLSIRHSSLSNSMVMYKIPCKLVFVSSQLKVSSITLKNNDVVERQGTQWRLRRVTIPMAYTCILFLVIL